MLAHKKLHSVGARRTPDGQDAALLRLARATIGLSQVAPRLSELAATRQHESERQAERARDVTTLTGQMSEELRGTLGMLQAATAEIGELTALIRRVADESSLIAINTGVAAARAGVEGRVFSVLAQEIRLLSQRTTGAAREVEAKLRRLQDSAEHTARVVGLGAARRDESAQGLGWLLARMAEAESSATRQAREAAELTTLGLGLRELSEEMLRAVGTFRLDAHRRAEALLESLRRDPAWASGDVPRQVRAMQAAVADCPYVELAYATDAAGIQVTPNVARSAFRASYGGTGLGEDWSGRAWFRGAARAQGAFTSEVYRSAATDEFCLTVAATCDGPGDSPGGVVALDVNFRQLLGDAA